MRKISMIVFALTVVVLQVSAQSGVQYVEAMMKKLLEMCEEKETINLFDCEAKIIANDKKVGNYRDGYNYTR